MSRASGVHSLVALLALALAAPAAHAQAQAEETVAPPPGRPIVVLPIGAGVALEATAAVARALVQRLNAPGKKRARLAYPITPVAVDARTKAKEKHAVKLLKRALTAYELMEYDKVIKQGDEVLKAYKDLLKTGTPAEGYVTALHLLAAAALLQGDDKQARRFMQDAIIFDPRAPSKKLFNPSVQEFYDQVSAEPARFGALALNASPTALVWFDGELHGLARGKVQLRAGLHLVRCYLPGYAPLLRWVRVEAGTERAFNPTLAKDDLPEDESLVRLREETASPEPGATVNQAVLDHGAEQVILIAAGARCTPAHCALRLHWSKDGKWHRHRKVLLAGRADVAAAALLGVQLAAAGPTVGPVGPGQPGVDNARACTLDHQCYMNERCKNGRCVRPTSVTRTWWFWTLIGAGVAGVTLAIVLPLTGPARPLIEVR